MSEPAEPTPTPSSPFEPRPTRPSGGGGCSKPLMIGCGIVLVLLGISAIVLVIKAPKLVHWAFSQMGQEVLSTLPEDIPQEDRQRLERAFDAVAAAAAEGKIDPARMQAFSSKVQALARKPKDEITRQDVVELARELEEAAGVEPPGEREAEVETSP